MTMAVDADSIIKYDRRDRLAQAAKRMTKARTDAKFETALAIVEAADALADESGVFDSRKVADNGLPVWVVMCEEIRRALYPVEYDDLWVSDMIGNALMKAGWVEEVYVSARGTLHWTGKWRWAEDRLRLRENHLRDTRGPVAQ